MHFVLMILLFILAAETRDILLPIALYYLFVKE